MRRALASRPPGPLLLFSSWWPVAGVGGTEQLSWSAFHYCSRVPGSTNVRRDMAKSGHGNCGGNDEESFLYFAYGSNLLTERIHLRNPSAAFCSVARLQDFKLDFGNSQGKISRTWHGGIATIFQSPGDEVWGVVWKMNKSNLCSLDEQEGVVGGTYDPIEVNVHTQEGKEITCRSYQMKNYVSAPPSPQYKKVICMGAKEHELPLDYQKKLEAIEPNDYKGKVSEEIENIIKEGEIKPH
ncbi:gamma-glutamylcyclotransferase [Tamandua tetradactyla]|uniref:gamma-glutamylcyclotransferase n=1 Tax=Tamandua tetradactyla TaxID=48850 RepID=UPI004053CD7D